MKNKRPFSPGVLIFLIYLIYIVLGMSGALMGAAWPSMYGGLGVPDSWLGILSVIISTGMVVTGVLLGRAIKRFGTGAIVVFCSAVSAVGSFGFAISPSFAVMCVLCAVVGFGGGFLDPVINSYVAVNYEARHMNLMHLSWGVGSMIGPFIVSFGITKTSGWRFSYLAVGGVQTVLLILIILTVALWGGVAANNESSKAEPPKETSAKLSKILRLPGIFWALASFFLYSAVEYVVALWGSSYLVHAKSLPPETAAWMLSLYFLGMTAGRGGSAFLSSKLGNRKMVRLGCAIMALGVAAFILPFGNAAYMAGFVLLGLGSAPVFPCLMHNTPLCFGEEYSGSVIGLQSASASLGFMIVPPMFSWVADRIGYELFPLFLGMLLILLVAATEALGGKEKSKNM